VALDLLAQAEHGEDTLVAAVSTDDGLLDDLAVEIGGRLRDRPTVAQAPCALVHAGDLETALAFCEALAPEHLELVGADAEALAPRVRSAGCLFVGASGATAFGDYVAGSNHTLPTGGAARFASGLSVRPLHAPHERGPHRPGGRRPGAARRAVARRGLPCTRVDEAGMRTLAGMSERPTSSAARGDERRASLEGRAGAGRGRASGSFDHMWTCSPARPGGPGRRPRATLDTAPTTPWRTRLSSGRRWTRARRPRGGSPLRHAVVRWTRRGQLRAGRLRRRSPLRRPALHAGGHRRLRARGGRGVLPRRRGSRAADRASRAPGRHERPSHDRGVFKAFARALRVAVSIDPQETGVPSTKGTLTG
jgi:hypothetical protein